MFIQGIIDLSFMAKDNAGEYLERGNMENIDEYPHKTLNVGMELAVLYNHFQPPMHHSSSIISIYLSSPIGELDTLVIELSNPVASA